MGVQRASETVEIAAPVERCFEIAADLDRAPEWHGTMKTVDVLERGPDGRATLIDTKLDAGVAQTDARLRFEYDPPDGMRWDQERGDLNALAGAWAFEPLDGGRTRATYSLELDPGRMLGMLARGPVASRLRQTLGSVPANGLKRQAERAVARSGPRA